MKSKNKEEKIKAAEPEIAEETKADETAKECPESGIDRENMTDEEYIGKLESMLGECMAESESARRLALRIQADFDNYRKRNAALSEEMKQLGISMVAESMLTVLDNCDLARKYVTDENALMGFNMMETQIISALTAFGLQEVEAEGGDFDAKTMNAVERVSAAGMDGKVTEVVSKGYTLKGKLLRPASVKVGREPEQN